jgi:hypothetical protein
MPSFFAGMFENFQRQASRCAWLPLPWDELVQACVDLVHGQGGLSFARVTRVCPNKLTATQSFPGQQGFSRNEFQLSKTIDITAPLLGVIAAIKVAQGDRVQTGDVLVEFV